MMEVQHGKPQQQPRHWLSGIVRTVDMLGTQDWLLDTIQNSSVDGAIWFEKILNAIVPELESTDSFSEFETYGSFCKLNYPSHYVERKLPNFRRGGLIQGRFVCDDVLQKLGEDFVTSSFEIYDRPPFPWGKLCEWYERWLKCKERFLKSII
jgi:hypothetical protein